MTRRERKQMQQMIHYLENPLSEVVFEIDRERVILRDHSVIVSAIAKVTGHVKTNWRGI